jgi:phage gp46-like protein
MQQGDVNLYHSTDDGEINILGGIVEMSGGLATAAYLSMFGGNENDDSLSENHLSWWGNLNESDSVKKYRSETQNLLRSIPATSGNLIRIEDAAKRDLSWFITEKVASSISISVSIPGLNSVKIVVKIEANGIESTFEFVENWKVGK